MLISASGLTTRRGHADQPGGCRRPRRVFPGRFAVVADRDLLPSRKLPTALLHQL